MADCLFCKILDGKIPAKKAYEDDRCLAFHDINPQAPVHILVIPRKHIASISDATAGDEPLLGHLLTAAAQIAREQKIADAGYRTVINTGEHAGQTVFHIHVHVIGGRDLGWPPG